MAGVAGCTPESSSRDGTSHRSRLNPRPMPPPPAGAAAPVAVDSVPAGARRSWLGAILTDIHFWVPVAVLAVGVGLLVYIS